VLRRSFSPGDKVFARWQGQAEFELVEKVVCESAFPHWKCKCFGGKRDDYWIIPEIHLSRKEISFLIKEHNRKQLSIV
jgi:hypothetical protein